MGQTASKSQSIIEKHDAFLAAHGWGDAVRAHLPGDFSARHYIRLQEKDRKALLMVMPKADELTSFMAMQTVLKASGVRVPEVHVCDEIQGIALIEDLGEVDFGSLLRAGTAPDALYSLAVDTLIQLHHHAVPHSQLIQFTPALFLEQVGLFIENYQQCILKTSFSPDAYQAFNLAWARILSKACIVPSSIMLRDFHAANIMYLPYETDFRKAALIDFQDGGMGPISYDIASLLEDTRIDVPVALREAMLAHYLQAFPHLEPNIFMASYHILAVQRHMRILGILAKRWVENGAPMTGEYFKRSWRLLMSHTSCSTLKPIYEWLEHYVPQPMRETWMP